MKQMHIASGILTILVVLMSCSTMTDLVSQAAGSVVVKAAESEVMDFKTEEYLCGNGESIMDVAFNLARVTRPATKETRNQAEVLYVRDGSKEWVSLVLTSHKAAKSEMQVGLVVLFPGGWWAEHDKISAEEYRKACWELGRITSIDDLFKDMVEVKGQKFYVQLLRVPDQPVK